MKHLEFHPEPQPDCFGCKIASINWGIVPGGFRDTNSGTMYDRDLLTDIPTREETEDRASTARRKIREASAEI